MSGDISKNNVKHKTIETGKKIQKHIIHDTYAEIPIKHNNTYIMAKIDIDDIEKCKLYYWSYSNGYVYCSMLMQSLHRYIMCANSGTTVDHINHDTFGKHQLVRFNNIDDAITWRSNKEAELFGEYNYKEQ